MSIRKNSLKGLIFVSLLLLGIVLYFFIRINKDNFVVSVKVFDNQKIVNNAIINVKDKSWATDDKGEARISLKANEGDEIVIVTNAEKYFDRIDTIKVDKERYKIGHTNLIIQLFRR